MATNTYQYFEQIIKSKGLTAYRVAKDTDINAVTFTKWKNGIAQPKYDKLSKIAAYLQVTVSELTGSEPEVTPKTLTDSELMFALFGDTENITQADLEDVKQFAQFIKQKKENR